MRGLGKLKKKKGGNLREMISGSAVIQRSLGEEMMTLHVRKTLLQRRL